MDAVARDVFHFTAKGDPENKHGKVNRCFFLLVGARSCAAQPLFCEIFIQPLPSVVSAHDIGSAMSATKAMPKGSLQIT